MSQTPSPTELAEMQSGVTGWFTDLCTISRDVITQGPYGEVTTPEVVAADVPCGLNAVVLPGVQQVISSRQAKVADATISLPFGTDIRVADDITITSQEDRQFETLYVEAPQSFQTSEQAYIREAV